MDDMNLIQLIQEFSDENQCRESLLHLRWPDGVVCPRCKGKSISRIVKRNQFDCDSCRYQFSIISGTIFHDSHLPLTKWFIAVYLMTESKKGMSANQIKRILGFKGYQTAWYLCHRIRKAMAELPLEKLSGIVEVDETYIGGKRRHVGCGYKGNKTMVLGAVQRGGHAHLRVENGKANKAVLRKFIEEQIDCETKPGKLTTRIMTDDNPSYIGAVRPGTIHQSVNHSREEWVRGDVYTNGVENAWSLFKRSVIGSYHNVSKKHLDAYLDEFEWRFNNRKNPFLFRDTLLKLISSSNLEYKKLTKDAA
jgi:transposase-like protein